MVNCFMVKPRSCLYWLVWLLCCVPWVAAFSQSNVTLKVEHETLSNVTSLITRQTGYGFVFYPSNWAQKANRVTVSVINEPLEKVLAICFKGQPFTYRIEDRTVVVKWQPSVPSQSIRDARRHMKVKVWVTDTFGVSISRVSIVLQRSGESAVTNDDGQLVLDKVDPQDSLILTATNYKRTVVAATPTLVVQMKVDADTLGAVEVSSGYDPRHSIGTNTGNISTIHSKEIARQPVNDFSEGLTGRVPGLFAFQRTGVPGAQVNMQVRGRNSLLTGNDLLIVIDGIPLLHTQRSASNLRSAVTQPDNGTGFSPLMSINPADIDSICILKDAAATALYGNQGSNGVLLINTKRGKEGKLLWDIDVRTSWINAVQQVEWMKTSDYLALREEGYQLDGLPITPETAPDLYWDRKAYTNFPQLLTGNTARQLSTRIAVSGGSAHTYYRFSGSHYRQDQVFRGPFKDSRTTGMLNLWHKASNRLSGNVSLLYGFNSSQPPRIDLSEYNNLPPHLQLLDGDGKLNWKQNGEYIYHISGITNPLVYPDKYYNFTSKNLIGSLQLSYHLKENLLLRLRTGFNGFHTAERFASPQRSLPPGTTTPRTAEFGKGRTFDWLLEQQLIYKHGMRNAQLTLLGSVFILQSKGSTEVIKSSGYVDDASLYSPAFAAISATNSDSSRYRNTAFSLNADYVWKTRYMVNVSIRMDGSNRFGGSLQFAPLGAIGAAWDFSGTAMMKDFFSFISRGKVRASWGWVGNDQVGDGKQIGYWYPNRAYEPSSGDQQGNYFDPSYTWERNQRAELGLEAGFFNNQLTVLAALYRNRSSQLLAKKSLPDNVLSSSLIGNSGAVVENKGLELTLQAQASFSRRLNWSCRFNITFSRNKLIRFPGIDSSQYGKQYRVGYSLSSYNAYASLGVNADNGLFNVATANPGGNPSPQDMRLAGNFDPQYYGGMEQRLFTKRWEFSFFMDFSKLMAKNYMTYAADHQPGLPVNQPVEVMNRWKRQGDRARWFRSSTLPNGSVRDAAYYMSRSTEAYTNTFFAKIRNVELAYIMPLERMGLKGIESCRLYVQGQNLFTFTNYEGDPETQDVKVLPLLRTIAVGVNIIL